MLMLMSLVLCLSHKWEPGFTIVFVDTRLWKTKHLRKRLGGKRGAGVPGCGKRGVWWETRGLVENAGSGGKHGENVFSPKYEFCSPKMRSRNFVTVRPLLSDHPRDFEKLPLNRGWPLNGGTI